MSLHKPLHCLLALTAAFAIGGCVTTQSPNFYLMSTVTPSSTLTVSAKTAPGVGPVTLPDYLQRQNLATRESTSRIHITPHDKWAAPLDAHLADLLAKNLGQRLDHPTIPVYPWPPGTKVTHQITVDVRDLIHYQDSIRLEVHWRLLVAGSVIVDRASDLKEPASDDYDSIVDAMSRAVGRLADEMAAAVHDSVATTKRPK